MNVKKDVSSSTISGSISFELNPPTRTRKKEKRVFEDAIIISDDASLVRWQTTFHVEGHRLSRPSLFEQDL